MPWSRKSAGCAAKTSSRSEEHTSELQSPCNLVCRLLLEKKKKKTLNATADPEQVRLCGSCPHDAQLGVHHAMAPAAPQHEACGAIGAILFFFFFNDTATTEIYTLSLHDALPI